MLPTAYHFQYSGLIFGEETVLELQHLSPFPGASLLT